MNSIRKLSHVNEMNQPQMVNVGGKAITHRVARAQATVHLPQAVLDLLNEGEIATKKGPVFQTAILAGTMAAKRTSDLIPLCHPIGLEDCKISIDFGENGDVVIECRVELHAKTGVEMEAMTGATIAALTIYDMCKGVSREICIRDVRLLEKTGGKRDFKA